MAETLDITLIHGFGEQPRGVDSIPGNGFGLLDGVDYGMLMLSSKGGVDLRPETIATQGLWSELLTDRFKSD